ncbi:MAG: type II CAAX prenyl endopeptidase Rce1 family protein [Bacteroides cellulosilyticus]
MKILGYSPYYYSYWIGPAEEIFWRGYVQNALSKRWSPNVGFIVTT